MSLVGVVLVLYIRGLSLIWCHEVAACWRVKEVPENLVPVSALFFLHAIDTRFFWNSSNEGKSSPRRLLIEEPSLVASQAADDGRED